MRHVEGTDRHQTTLLPESLDDFVDASHPVRVIDAYVDTLDTQALGFDKATPKETGRKPYHPGDLLKLYLYGYLNKVMSSRRLETECHRNIEVMWLLKRLRPDFKTIANFRKDNGSAITNASRAFIQFCREANLLTGQLVAIDGSKFQASASIKQAINRKQLARDRTEVEQHIERYLARLDEADDQDNGDGLQRDRVQQTLAKLRAKAQRLSAREQIMNDANVNQHCETEADARLLRSPGRGNVLGYNVQTAVEAQTGLIVHHEVTNESGDLRMLQPMAVQTKKVLDAQDLQVVADAGYSNGEHLDRCEQEGITATAPRRKIPSKYKQMYQKADFTYDPSNDHYVCPAGEILRRAGFDKSRNHYLYKRKGCNECHLQARCTTANTRTLTRHKYEQAYARSEARLQANPDLMKVRMSIVERPFAVLKETMGLRRFQCRGIAKARAEMSIAVLAFNLRHMINRLGAQQMLRTIK